MWLRTGSTAPDGASGSHDESRALRSTHAQWARPMLYGSSFLWLRSRLRQISHAGLPTLSLAGAQTSTDQRGTCTAASIDSRRTRQWRSAPSTRVHMLPFMQANHGGPEAAAEGLAAARAVRVASAAMPAVTPRGFSSSILHWSEQPQLHPCLRWFSTAGKWGRAASLVVESRRETSHST